MRLVSALSRLLAMLAVVGLLVGTFAGSATALPADAGVTMVVADGMPPCDEQTPDCRDMKDCPSAVLCVAKSPQNFSGGALIVARLAIKSVMAPTNQRAGNSLAVPPLARPPEA